MSEAYFSSVWAIETEKDGTWTRWNEYTSAKAALDAAEMILAGAGGKVRLREFNVGRSFEFSSCEELQEYREGLVG